MKTLGAITIPLIALFALEVLGSATLVWSGSVLPPQVASHFDAQGQPDGWMNRSSYLWGMAALGLLMPLFLIGIGLSTAVLPAGSINLPHREYWLSAEQRPKTNRYIARHFAWLACAVISLSIAINWLVVEANRSATPHLSNSVWLLLPLFLGFVLAWVVALVRHFSTVFSGVK